MTNEELNRKVHQVRGECWHTWDLKIEVLYSSNPKHYHQECLVCGDKVPGLNEPERKDYPGNIAHAWELVESLSVDKQAQVLINKLGREILVGNLNIKDSPTAICLAYIEVNGD